MPNTEVKLLSADGSRTDVPLEQDVARQYTNRMDAMSRIETVRSLFLYSKIVLKVDSIFQYDIFNVDYLIKVSINALT